MTEFKVDITKLPPALRAQIDSVLKEIHQRNKICLVDHVLFAESHRETMHKAAEFLHKDSQLDVHQMCDVIKAAIVAYACNDLIRGAEKFIAMMAFSASWAEKLELIRLASREPDHIEH